MRESKRKVTIVGLLQAAAVVTILFSLLTGFDISNYAIELFSHFRLQYFGASVLLALIFLVLRRFRYASALVLVAIFNASFVLPFYFDDVQEPGDTSLKLIHANVHSSNVDYQRLVHFIDDEQPDIFILQEINPEWVLGTDGLLTAYPYVHIVPRRGNFGIAAFSKIPFDAVSHIDSPPLAHPTIVATITVNEKPITLISSHPTIPISGQLYQARNEQLVSIAGLVNQASSSVVLMGDFNTSIWDTHFRELENATGLINARRGFGILPSWPTFLPFAMIPIDHALVSGDITVTDLRTGRDIGSDHLPLIITLAL